MSLKQFLQEQGITTYESLVERCRRLGVASPTESEYALTDPAIVTNPGEGVIVIDPIPITLEKTGKKLEEIVPRLGFVDLKGIENKPEKLKRPRRRKKVEETIEETTSDEVDVETDIPEPTSIENVIELDRVLSGNAADNE